MQVHRLEHGKRPVVADPSAGPSDLICRLARERDLTFYQSWASHSDRQERAVLFYHCPKTGGITVDYALSRALACVDAISRQGLFIGRLDDLKVPPGKKVGTPAAFVATHDPFGMHRKLAQDFDLVTLVREPAARVTSHYTYQCMRGDLRPRIDDFRGFYGADENANVMVRQLSGKPKGATVGDDDLAQAIDNLDRHFAFFATSDHVHELISSFISRFRAPNVIMAHMNRTLPEYRIDASAHLDEIRRLNHLDARLFARVQACPRRLPVKPRDGALSPMTIYLEEVEKARRTLQRPYYHRTHSLPALLAAPQDAMRSPTWDD